MLRFHRFSFPIFLAADKDDTGGSGPSDKKPTLLERVTAAEQARDQHAADLATAESSVADLTKERDEAKAESTRLAGLFTEATKAASDAQAALKTAQDAVTALTRERDTLKTKTATADKSIARLEALCGVKGVNKDAAPAEAPQAANSTAAYDEWQSLRKSDPAKATAYFRKNQDALRAHAAALG